MIKCVELTVSTSLKYKETTVGESLLHKIEYSIERKFLCNYRAAVRMLCYLQGYNRPYIYMAIHQCVNSTKNHVKCKSAPSDTSQSIFQVRQRMCIYQMVLSGYPHAA